MPLTPELWRQREEDICEFYFKLVYRAEFYDARAIQRHPVRVGMGDWENPTRI